MNHGFDALTRYTVVEMKLESIPASPYKLVRLHYERGKVTSLPTCGSSKVALNKSRNQHYIGFGAHSANESTKGVHSLPAT
jgi:hypothetical protein